MPFKLFGWEFDFDKKSSKPGAQTTKPTGTALSPVPPENTEGALNIQYGAGGGYYGYYLDLDGAVNDDFALIMRYREMAMVPEVDEAVDQIINEIVIQDAGRMPVSLDLDYVDNIEEPIKIRLQAEFDSLLKQLNFHKDAYSVVRQWYVDGRIYYYLIVDENAPENGILEIRLVDPRTIKKVREVTRKRHEETQTDVVEVQREYFVYNPMGFATPNINGTSGQSTGSMLQYNGIKISVDAIAFTPSGLFDPNRRSILSWLHKAIKPLNLMRMMEDSCVIYRISRAPERRVFYIDVGNMPKNKAEQYLNDMMTRYRNKMVYDVNTGELRDDRKFMSILEDFWLPRREGGKGTEITTLPAGQNLSEMEDVDYFRRKLYRALGLPPSRIDQGTGFSLGRDTEISRDELRFNKFVHRLQAQFNTLFDQMMEKQLRLKGIMTQEDWYRVKDNIRYTWQTDSYFEELKSQAVWTTRMALLQSMDAYKDRYFSEKWIQREVLKFTDDEMAAIREEFTDAAGEVIPPGGKPDELQPGFGEKNNDASGLAGSDNPFGDSLDKDADALLADSDEESDEDDDTIGKLNDDEDGVSFNGEDADEDDDELDLDDDEEDSDDETESDDEDDDSEQDLTDDEDDEDEDDEPKKFKGVKSIKAGKKKKKSKPDPFGKKSS